MYKKIVLTILLFLIPILVIICYFQEVSLNYILNWNIKIPEAIKSETKIYKSSINDLVSFKILYFNDKDIAILKKDDVLKDCTNSEFNEIYKLYIKEYFFQFLSESEKTLVEDYINKNVIMESNYLLLIDKETEFLTANFRFTLLIVDIKNKIAYEFHTS